MAHASGSSEPTLRRRRRRTGNATLLTFTAVDEDWPRTCGVQVRGSRLAAPRGAYLERRSGPGRLVRGCGSVVEAERAELAGPGRFIVDNDLDSVAGPVGGHVHVAVHQQ